MKTNCIAVPVLFFCFSSMAQLPSAADIKKNRIKSIIVTAEEEGTAQSKTSEIFYNENGDDTASYESGLRSTYKEIEYNHKLQLIKITGYNTTDGKTGFTSFVYKPDGSYVSTYTDVKYGMKNIATYNTKGNIISYTIPDGSLKKYTYNSKGQLIKAFTIPKNDGIKFNQTFIYNNKGKLVSSKTTGDYPSSATYTYDSKGLVIKLTTKANYSGEEVTYIDNYSYTY